MNPTISKLLELPLEQREKVLNSLSPEELFAVTQEIEAEVNSPKRRWYCTREICDGEPHAGFHWCDHPIDSESHTPYCKHARTPQRPPAEDPDKPWLTWFFSGGRGTGKALSLNTLIPTPFGWVKMGEIKVGDVVFDEQGRMCNVTATFDVTPNTAYKLIFSDGSEIIACDEHQWVTLEARERKQLNRKGFQIPEQWAAKPPITTSALVETLTYGKRKDRNHAIPLALPLQTPTDDLPIDPYVLGVWLGDGSSASAEITCHDDDAPHYEQMFAFAGEAWRLARRRHNDKPVGTYCIGERDSIRSEITGRMEANGSVHSRLRLAGLLNNKHIPTVYLRADITQRLALLQGLMDTDGGVDKRTGTVEFTSTKRHLAEGVLELARSLGQKPTLAVGRATLYGKDCGPKFRVTWRPTVAVFSLPRKASFVRPIGKQQMRNACRMVVSADIVDTEPMRCLTVDSPNSMYLAGEAMIPTHNTRAGAEWVLDLVWNQGYKRIALVGRTPADVRDVMIYGDSGIMSVSSPHPRPEHEPTKRRLVWPNGAQAFTYSAAAPSQLRGPQHDAAWCVAEGELVATSRGEIPIEDVVAGDFVWTRKGLKKVLASTVTNTDAEIMEIETADGKVLRCTPNHRVWANGEWKLAEDVSLCDRMTAWISPSDPRHGLIGIVPAGIGTRLATTKTTLATFSMLLLLNGKRAGVLLQKKLSTISTTIKATISPATYRLCLEPTTSDFTWESEASPSLARQPAWGRLLYGLNASLKRLSATNVASSISASECGQSFAQKPVVTNTSVSAVRKNGQRGVVYDLAVENAHEFFASGLLVHNCDELAAWTDAPKGDTLDTSWNNLMLGLRLGTNPKALVTTTPKRVKLVRQLMERKSTVITNGTTYDNLKNMAPSFREQVLTAYEGTRIGRQELDGVVLTDVEGALWSLEMIDATRGGLVG